METKVIQDVLYAVVILGASGLIWDGWRRYLAKESTTVAELKNEIAARDADFAKRFAVYEKAHDALVTRFNAAAPSPNPLGKTYSTQRAG